MVSRSAVKLDEGMLLLFSSSWEDNVQHTFQYSFISILTDSKVAHMYKMRLMFSYVMHKGRILKLRKRNSLRNKTPFWRERVDQLASQLGESWFLYVTQQEWAWIMTLFHLQNAIRSIHPLRKSKSFSPPWPFDIKPQSCESNRIHAALQVL